MKHVETLRNQWTRYCDVNYQKHKNRIISIENKIRKHQGNIDNSIENHEYANAEINEVEIGYLRTRLKNYTPMNFEEYVTREFSKDYKTIVGNQVLSESDQLFFKIYYYRKYMGFKVNEVLKKQKITYSNYHNTYKKGQKKFFSMQEMETEAEVG